MLIFMMTAVYILQHIWKEILVADKNLMMKLYLINASESLDKAKETNRIAVLLKSYPTKYHEIEIFLKK